MMGVGPAAFFIKDAVIGKLDAPYEGWYDPYHDPSREGRNFLSLLCGRIVAYRITNRILLAANWILFCLSFIEPPQWCRDSPLLIAQNNTSDSLSEYGDCKVILGAVGTAVDGTEGVELYPNSNAMWLSAIQSQHVEIACLGIIATFVACQFGRDGFSLRLFFYPGTKRLLHVLRIVIILCLCAGLMVGNTAFNPICRMILLGSFLRNFQTELYSVVIMLPQVIYILAVITMLTFFYGWFGVVLFYGSPQGEAGFQNIVEGVWTLYIMITTANYPDVSFSL
jgi:Ion transport protein